MGKAPRQLPINSRSTTASCGQCSALMLPNASVCKRCGGLAADYDRRIDYVPLFIGTDEDCRAIAASVRGTMHTRQDARREAVQA